MICASGRSRRARRIAWRAWRSASAVTAQVLMITASLRPPAAACARTISDSATWRRKPKVMISSPDMGLSKIGEIEAAIEAGRDRPGHDDVAVAAPFDREGAAVEDDFGPPPDQAAAAGGDEPGAGSGAAGAGDADAAFPHPQAQPFGRQHLGDADIGALG